MSNKLNSLVRAADDPAILLYVINNLGRGVPNQACFASTVQSMRLDAMRSLLSGRWQINRMRNNPMQEIWRRKQFEMIEDRIMPALLAQQERQLTASLFQQASLSIFIDKLVIESPAILRKQLHNDNTMIRLVALSAIGRRHLHLEEDLIESLGDSHPAVQLAAHDALVRVARGTDFGPALGASQRSIDRSIDKWKQWLTLQRSASPQKKDKLPTLEMVPLILVDEERSTPPKAAKNREDRKK